MATDPKTVSHYQLQDYKKSAAFLLFSCAIIGFMRKGYSAALRFYPNTGGGGFNIYKTQVTGARHRYFAIDYHPLWNPDRKAREWTLHYHRGKTLNEIKKHRPYQQW